MVVTRWNPTANGPLHCGHLFSLLVNERFAHDVGGQFFVRFDNTGLVATHLGERMDGIIRGQLQDLEWLGMQIDGFVYQNEVIDYASSYLKNRDFKVLDEPSDGLYVVPHYVRLGSSYIAFPYAPKQTAERVVMDHMIGVTHVIRGEDFLTEYSHYCYVCQYLGFETPEFVFLPRLASVRGDISKTNGGFTIAEYRQNGYSAQDLKDLIARSCLINPATGWKLYNIKSCPVLV
jgi:glutamyl/glutaminyl-tRNA synthetase